ncbi:MAG TPA: hypothetical protein VNI84_19140 [Pyrinomonadaceae bacterium]|nr:hypothetical protein [Pyrinomonadaceae bacterium]
MKNIEFIKTFEPGKIGESEKPKDVKEIFKGVRRRIIQINLRNGEVLSRHKTSEPITVSCPAGSGAFQAGRDLKDERKLVAGTLITLKAALNTKSPPNRK